MSAIDPRIDVATAQDLAIDFAAIAEEEAELTDETRAMLNEIVADFEDMLDEIGEDWIPVHKPEVDDYSGFDRGNVGGLIGRNSGDFDGDDWDTFSNRFGN